MEPSDETTTTSTNSAAIPVAIVLGFAMIALAIFFTSNATSTPPPTPAVETAATEKAKGPRPVDETDYILGNPNASILMIEYSDYDCPFCQQFHATMHQIMDEYGVTGKVAWVYRQYPIAVLHPNSPVISEAALCVGDIGGNDAFWSFSDLIYSQRDVTEQTNITRLTEYAVEAGVSATEYTECMESDRMEASVLADLEDGYNAGVQGTPYTILAVGNQKAIIDGAQSYESVKVIVQDLIAQLNGKTEATTEGKAAADVPTNAAGVPILE